tara:strand:+ start:410 stop:592 length:183 start_codon:yes stop_codon:yes gene_type:complete
VATVKALLVCLGSSEVELYVSYVSQAMAYPVMVPLESVVVVTPKQTVSISSSFPTSSPAN